MPRTLLVDRCLPEAGQPRQQFVAGSGGRLQLVGVWIIGQGGDGCADSTHAVLVSHVTAR